MYNMNKIVLILSNRSHLQRGHPQKYVLQYFKYQPSFSSKLQLQKEDMLGHQIHTSQIQTLHECYILNKGEKNKTFYLPFLPSNNMPSLFFQNENKISPSQLYMTP